MDDKVKNRLIVCGDSWNTPVIHPQFKGTHWSELLSEEINYELLSFAQPGCSNRAIVKQVLRAIQLKPDLIIACNSTSSAERVEIMGTNYISPKSSVQLEDLYYGLGRYNPLLKYYQSADNTIWSLPILSITDKKVQDTYLQVWPSSFMEDIDYYLILFLLRKLEVSKIPYIFYPSLISVHRTKNNLKELALELAEFSCNPKKVLQEFDHRPYWQSRANKFFDPGYHTPPEIQVEVKNKLVLYLEELNLIKAK